MDRVDHEIIFESLCLNIRAHQKIIKDKDGIIQSWQTSFHEEVAARNNFRNLYFEHIELLNAEKDKIKGLESTIEDLKKEVEFWRDKHLSRSPERRPGNDVSFNHAKK